MADRLATLAEIETAVWAELELAARSKAHEWRTPVLATVDGDAADARTVVLREVDAQQNRLTVFTDQRAGKVAQLLSHPRACFVMWSPTLGWQLRCRVVLTLQTTGLAGFWERIKLTPSAQDYLAALSPGAPLNASSQAAPGPGEPTPAQSPCFAVVNAQVQSIDWLELHRDGHRRAVFGDGTARWVQP